MYRPNYQITSQIARSLVRIELIKEQIKGLPITPSLLMSLRKSAKLSSVHYSTQIEGNKLTQAQVEEIIVETKHIKGRERDEKEVLGYYDALDQVNQWATEAITVNQNHIQRIHALVMGDKRVKFTAFRDGQNVIRDSSTGQIIYMPPEAKDVLGLINELIDWIASSQVENIPDPIRAAIVHYQFATIHPYYDGNGRTSRLLTNLILYLSGYDLKGIYSLEEYYAQALDRYYGAISVGSSHNYYLGRAEADITNWIEYFCESMATSFEKVRDKAQESQTNQTDQSKYLKQLDSRQKKVLQHLQKGNIVTSKDIQALLQIKPRNAAYILNKWVREGFFDLVDESKKNRAFRISNPPPN